MAKIDFVCPIEDLERVPRKDLLEGIYGRFDHVLEARLEQDGRTPEAQEKLRKLFEHLIARHDWRDYAEIQKRHLAPENRREAHNLLKYLNAAHFLEQKMQFVRLSGIEDRAPGRLLDLGAGPGHFDVICAWLGWDVLALDHPLTGAGKGDSINHLYHDLAEFWGIPRVLEAVNAQQPLQSMEGRFDAVTAFMINFNSVSRRGETPKEWSVDDWYFLLRDLNENRLTENGFVFLNPLEGLTSPEIWDVVSSHAEQPLRTRWAGKFTDFAFLEAAA